MGYRCLFGLVMLIKPCFAKKQGSSLNSYRTTFGMTICYKNFIVKRRMDFYNFTDQCHNLFTKHIRRGLRVFWINFIAINTFLKR